MFSEIGILKWNVDVSYCKDKKLAVVGGVLRDWNSNFRCLFFMFIG